MELCLQIGGVPGLHPEYLFEFISARQFDDWKEFYNRDPFGEWRADERQRMLLTAISGMMTGKMDETWEGFYFPYFKVDTRSNKEAMKTLTETDSLLVPKPGGGYEWKK